MTETKRAYNSKDVDMLTACSIIVEQANQRKDFLISKRPAWADPYFANLKAKIDKTFSEVFGLDNAGQLREATAVVTEVQGKVLTLLAELKVQVEEDFKKDKNRLLEVLNTLGFKDYHKDVQKKDQQATIQLLARFKKSMNNKLKKEITDKGIAAKLIDDIVAQADVLNNSNIVQETFKGQKKEITQSMKTAFNEIYNEVIGIARIAAKFYKGNPPVQDVFSFNKTVKKLGLSTGKSSDVVSIPQA